MGLRWLCWYITFLVCMSFCSVRMSPWKPAETKTTFSDLHHQQSRLKTMIHEFVCLLEHPEQQACTYSCMTLLLSLVSMEYPEDSLVLAAIMQ